MISGGLSFPAGILGAIAGTEHTIHCSNTSGLGVVDWAVIGIYLAIVLAQGWHYSRGQTTAGEFLVASRKPMSPGIVGLALYATLLRTITYLAKPGEIISKGPVSSLAQIASMPLVYLIVAGFILPIIMARRIEVVDFGLSQLAVEGVQVFTMFATERISAKVLVLLPNQTEPEHWHPPVGNDPGKEETSA